MKKLFSLIVVILILTSSFQGTIYANENIKVVIDGDIISFDVPPQIINGRTMVPLRGIFEYLGAEVTWDQNSQAIRSSSGNFRMFMQVGKTQAGINGSSVVLDSPPVIIDGRTLVPVRVIAEAFSSTVTWDGESKTVIIETPYPKNKHKSAAEFDKYHLRTSYGDFEYFDISISANKLKISGKLKDQTKDSILIKIGEINETFEKGKDGTFNISINLDNAKISEFSLFSVYLNIPGTYQYTSYTYNSIKIINTGSEYFFEKPLVYDNNLSFFEKWINPIVYTNYKVDERIVALSDEICKNSETDYEKLLALHTWVCENVYYDYDYFYNKNNPLYYSDVEVLEARRTVCGGYTNLLLSLIRAQGIPARCNAGYALGLGSSVFFWEDTSADVKTSNHIWIQAYIDNRWLNIDATWDSGNKYENGQFKYGGIENYLHFDISDAMIAMDHKIISVE